MTTHPTPGLSEIQAAFQDRLLTGSDDLIAHLGDGARFLAVYDNAYAARLLEALGEDFDALHALLGDEQFDAAMRGYVAAHPSRHRSIRWLGQHLADWLRTAEPWRDLPQLADMAAFEWALGLAFDAVDAPVLRAEALAGVAPETWPGLAFDFHPALTVVDLAWDVVPFQQAVVAETDPEAAPELFDAPVAFAAWRDPESLTVLFRPMEPVEAAALAAARDGADFSRLCEIVAEAGEAETAAMQAAGLLKAWIDAGWIAALAEDGLSRP